jgi:hypothetical protein
LTIDSTEPPEEMSLTLMHNTVLVPGPFLLVSQGSGKTKLAAKSKNPIRFHASSNVFYGQQPLLRATACGQVIDVADAENLQRGIFRLDLAMSGIGAGPDGTDIGADVGLLGPGAAYQRWKKAPEYNDWRRKTNALMQARGGQPPTLVP